MQSVLMALSSRTSDTTAFSSRTSDTAAVCCAGFRPLYKVLRRDMNSRETLFAGLAGLRGSVSLILAQAVITEDKGGDSTSQV